MANKKYQKLKMKGVTAKLLSALPSKNKEVLERRFGLRTGSPETLESIGQSYKITRERVRQIQEYGLKRIREGDQAKALEPLFGGITDYIESRGGIASESSIFSNLIRPEDKPQITLILRLFSDVVFAKETDDVYPRYAMSKEALEEADNLIARVHAILTARFLPVVFSDLVSATVAEAEKLHYRFKSKDVIESILSLSRKLKKGPFGEYGLADWPSITPRGVRDKAHLVFEREKKPLHFREISSLIDKYFSNSADAKATHAQTVHNELIKDPRFVLIGRGLYALSDWGYEAGTVKDVLVQVLKEQGCPLTKDELFEIVAERRFVKPNTVFLNLQNKRYFKKVEQGKYYLA